MNERHSYASGFWARFSCVFVVLFCLLVLSLFPTTNVLASEGITSFNQSLLAEELISLAKKGIRVRVKIDAEKAGKRKPGALIARMRDAGISVQSVAPNGRNHNKFAVIDGKQVITGSYNWTKKAEQNWENLLLLNCPELARRYAMEWERIQ